MGIFFHDRTRFPFEVRRVYDVFWRLTAMGQRRINQKAENRTSFPPAMAYIAR